MSQLIVITNQSRMIKKLFLIIYYSVATHLPSSYMPIFGRPSNAIRVFCVKRIFKKCGKITTIDRHAYFGNGSEIEMGDYSGIGERCVVPHNTRIGRYVMMAPEVHIVANNHNFSDTSTPMCFQHPEQTHLPTIIEDDCWLGVRCILTPGHTIGKGSIIAAGAVVTHDVPPYSIWAGNPARMIRSRMD